VAASALGAYRDALGYVEAALPHADRDRRPRLLELRADLLAAAADPSASAAYREAISAAGRRRDVVRTRLARFLVAAGDMAAAAEALTGIEVEQHGPAHRARMLFVQGIIAWSAGDTETAAQMLDVARPLALAEGLQPEMFDAIALRGLVAHQRCAAPRPPVTPETGRPGERRGNGRGTARAYAADTWDTRTNS
jgi:hypothetical protein